MTEAAITEQQKSAYHEAGHAVIRHLFGSKVESVSIGLSEEEDGEGVTAGDCICSGYAEWREEYIVEARQTCPDIETAIEIVCLLAGMLAQSKVALINIEEWVIQDDFTEIGKLLPEAHGKADMLRKLDLLQTFCQEHIKRRGSQINALAKALLADGKIVKAEDIRRILGPVTLSQRKVIFDLANVYGAMEAS